MNRSAKQYFTEAQLQNILDSIGGVRIGVLGDFCMDMYWYADMTRSQLSRETPHYPLPIVAEKMSPGAAGNVAANIASLRPKALSVFGAVGCDWRATLLKEALLKLGARTHLIEVPGRMTNAYIKPMMKGISDVVYEAPRLDFENDADLPAGAEDMLIDRLCREAQELDVLCVCDQMAKGCVTPRVRETVEQLAQNGLRVIVDSRDNIALYHHVIVKPNEVEAARALGADTSPESACRMLAGRSGTCAIVTVGGEGCWISCGEEAVRIPACPVNPPIDICGAGDTFLSAFACCLAGGAAPETAAAIGNLASSVTIRKIGTTGTASREELIAAYKS